MRPVVALVLLGWSILCSGCALIEDGSRNMCVALSAPFEAHRENARNRRWAEAAWQEFSCKLATPHSDDYAQGFKDGYAEYLFRGGDGEPPLVAPLRYRHTRYQNPNGFRAIEEWFAGYRHGAGVARDTGARQWITGPSGLHGDSPDHGMDVQPIVKRGDPKQEPVIVLDVRKNDPVTPVPLPPRLLPIGPSIEITPEPGRLEFAPTPHKTAPATPAPPRAKITNVSTPEPEPTKARIAGISVPEPVRARITNISVVPSKE